MRPRTLTRLFLRYRARRDGHALARVFDATAPELLGVAAHLVRDAQLAEDLVQATFLAAIERADAFDPARELKPWLYGILVREAAKQRRRAARESGAEVPEERASSSPLERLSAGELPRAVRETLERAPRRHREVLAPLLLEGRSSAEIARALGRSPGTVRMQVHRALEWLRRALPAGLAAGAAAALLPTRGLGGVRAEVLRAAGVSLAPTAAAAATIGGLAMAKKMLVAGGAVALAALVWVGARPAIETAAAVGPSERAAVEEREQASVPAPVETREVLTAEVTAAAAVRDEPAASPSGAPLRGRVVGADGRPVAGARVLGGRSPDAAEELARADAAGRFSVVPGDSELLHLHARAAGRAPSYTHRVEVAAAGASELELALTGAAARLEVTLRDQAGGPVAGASVRVGGRAEQTFLDGGARVWTPPASEMTSDDDGRAHLDSLPPGNATVLVRAEGFVPTTRELDLRPGALTTLELLLSSGWAVEGRVVDRSGEPVGGAYVWARKPGSDTGFANVRTRSDAQGRYHLSGLPRRGFVALASKRGTGRVESGLLTAETGTPAVWNAVLAASPTVAGRVVDERGAPLAGWNVLVHPPGEPGVWNDRAETDEDGRFEVDDLPDFRFHVSVRSPALWDGGPVLVVGAVEPGTDDLSIQVPDERMPGAGFVARVRYRSGTPAPRAAVRYLREGEDTSWTAEVDPEDGSIRKERLRPGTYELQVSGEGLVFDPVATRTFAAGETVDLGELVLDDPGLVSLRVEAPDDPLRGGFETWLVSTDATGRRLSRIVHGLLPERFPLPPGEYEIAVRATHYRCAPLELVVQSGVELAPGLALEPATLITLRFVPAEGGAALGAIELWDLDEAGTRIWTRTVEPDPDGALALTLDLEPGIHRLRAQAEDGRIGDLSLPVSPGLRGDSFEVRLAAD